MSCKNKCHENIIKLDAVSITISGTNMIIDIEPLKAFTNYKSYGLNICMRLPENTGVETVSLSDGASTYPLMDSNGQPVVSSMMNGCSRYRVKFGAGGSLSNGNIPAHFTVCSGLNHVKYSSNAAYQGGFKNENI